MAVEQEPGGELISLLPDGVKANIDDTRKLAQYKNLVTAGAQGKGYKAFFAADDGTHGEELWVTDGTVAGTKMVKDINPGSSSSSICWMHRFNDKVVFSADNGEDGSELWISDGTEEGTYMVLDIHDFGSSDPRGFMQVNENQFIFAAKNFDSEIESDRGQQWWLWVSDGTASGTELIYECDMRFPGQDFNTREYPYCRVGRRVFFKADNINGTVGEELWVTDGTRAGTKFVKDLNVETIATGTANSAIDNMVNFYNELLFVKAFSIESNNEPWASDGTPEGTYQIYDTNPTFEESGFPRGGGATEQGFFPYNGKVYCRGYALDKGFELACTNLEEGEWTVMDINTNEPTSTNHSFADSGCEFDGVYMFCAATGLDANLPNNYGGEVHYTDGTTVKMQSDLAPGTASNWAKELVVASGSLYFVNTGGELAEYKEKLFRLDSKDEMPVRVTNLNADGDKIHSVRNMGGDIIFATFDTKGLYRYSYRKPSYDPAKDTDSLDLEYRTRQEISTSLIQTKADKVAFQVYPNPTSDYFSFDVSDAVKVVIIYDTLGAIVKQVVAPEINTIDVSGLNPGMYPVVIRTESTVYNASLIVK